MNAKTKGTAKVAHETAQKTVDAVLSAGKDAAENFVKAGTEAYTKGYEKAMAMTKENVDSVVKGYADLAAWNKGNVEAAVAASNVATKGFEVLSAEFLAFTKTQMEESVAQAKKVFGAKTLKEVMDLQSEFAKTAFDTAIGKTAKLSDLAVKTANQAYEPLQARVTVAVEKFVKPMAA